MTYKLKPLKWGQYEHTMTGEPIWWRDSLLGKIRVRLCGTAMDRFYWCCEEQNVTNTHRHETLDAAKAAAEQWYQEKIASALEPASKSVEEAVEDAKPLTEEFVKSHGKDFRAWYDGRKWIPNVYAVDRYVRFRDGCTVGEFLRACAALGIDLEKK